MVSKMLAAKWEKGQHHAETIVLPLLKVATALGACKTSLEVVGELLDMLMHCRFSAPLPSAIIDALVAFVKVIPCMHGDEFMFGVVHRLWVFFNSCGPGPGAIVPGLHHLLLCTAQFFWPLFDVEQEGKLYGGIRGCFRILRRANEGAIGKAPPVVRIVWNLVRSYFACDAGSFDCLPERIYNRTFDCLGMAQAALQDMLLQRPNVAELQGLVCCLISFHFGPDWAQELCAASIPHLDERDVALVARWTTVEQCCGTHPPFTCIVDAVRNYEVRCVLDT